MKTRRYQNEIKRLETNPEYYKWGIFYYNPMDTRIILPKRAPWMGWTLNFANLWSYIIMISIIGIAILIGYLDKSAR